MAEKIHKKHFFIESLGCAKNSVDSRSMAELLARDGYIEDDDPKNAEVIIVNTCGFILPARDESLNVLRDFAVKKSRGQILIAAGCLSERDKHRIFNQVSGLNAVTGTRRWADILRVIEKTRSEPDSPYLHFPPASRIIEDNQGITRAAIQGASAYLKIADGCDRKCAFCAIPLIKGPMVSRPVNSILDDARKLQREGIKEIVLIAQDTTSYGRDIGLEDGLPHLLTRLLEAVPDVPWLRIMYMFPGAVSDSLIQIMAENWQILPYLDLPFQHSHPDVLSRMMRPSDQDNIKKIISRMRSAMPELSLRTTFIVGYPQETEEEFQALLDFVREIRFDRVGIFPYFHEEGTQAFDLKNDVSVDTKNDRIHKLALIQEEISLQINREFIGKHLDVLIEGNGDGISIGRSYRDAPEIDGLVLLDELIQPGQMVEVKITGALVHDLLARQV